MTRKLIDILHLIGGDTQHQVENAVGRWRNDIREQIKGLTGFKLSYRENGKVVQVTVPLSVEPGLPAPLEPLMNEELPDDERWSVELSQLGRNGLKHANIRQSSGFISPTPESDILSVSRYCYLHRTDWRCRQILTDKCGAD